jgi:zinc transporter ZupT
MLVHGLLGYHHSHRNEVGNTQEISGSDNEDQQNSEEDGPLPPCCAADPCAQIDQIQHMAEVMQARELTEAKNSREVKEEELGDHEEGVEEKISEKDERKEEEKDEIVASANDDDPSHDAAAAENRALAISKAESQKLSRMSLNTAVAIGLHNFPEGRLCAFFGTQRLSWKLTTKRLSFQVWPPLSPH